MKLNIKIKVNDLKLAILFIVSLFVLGQAFLALAENKNNPNELFLDSDQDGLSDQEEKQYGTDPNNPDTDRDGYTDGVEVKSGYNPLKPSPGDKIDTVISRNNTQAVPILGQSLNLTQELNKQLSNQLSSSEANSENNTEEATIESLRTIVQNFLTENTSAAEFVPLTTADIKVKKQNYSDLSDEEKKEKMTEDFTDYSISLFYVLSLNSEKPILSTQDFDESSAEVIKEISNALLANDSDYFNKLGDKTQKVLGEIKDVEVPEEFQDLHVKMINLLSYGLSLKSLAVRNTSDPVLNMVNFSKINSFFEAFSSFSDEFKIKSNQYELDNDLIKERLEKMGIDTSSSQSTSNSETDLSLE